MTPTRWLEKIYQNNLSSFTKPVSAARSLISRFGDFVLFSGNFESSDLFADN